MRIGIDIDGVLFPWDAVARVALGAGQEPSGHWYGLRDEVTKSQWSWLWNTDEGRHAVFGQVEHSHPDAIEAVRGLLITPRCEVHFVTHRDPSTTLAFTSRFLNHHFAGYRWHGVHSIRNGTPKRRLARWDVFVDDKPETIWDFAKRSPRVKLFAPRRAWNTDLEGDRRLTYYEDAAAVLTWVRENA